MNTARRFVVSRNARVGLVLGGVIGLLALSAGAISSGQSPFYPVGAQLRPPSWAHLMGTDQFGRDVLRSVAYGARTSLTTMVCVAAVSAVIGVTVGTVAGYRGGLVDDALMRLTEVLQAIPRFFIAVLAVAVFGSSVRVLIVVLGLTSWAFLARVVRAETLSIREREFVQAARSLGGSGINLVLRHVVPNVIGPAIVVITLVGSRVVLLEASLAFLGLTDADTMSWGLLIKNAEAFLRVAWWVSVFPGIALVMAVLGLNLMSDALNDILNRAPGAVGRDGRPVGEPA